MNHAPLILKTGTATVEQIREHLVSCSQRFMLPLDSRVDIGTYARKIAQNADTFEAWHGDTLIGLVAAYMNDQTGRRGHITNTSVTADHEGKGIASALMKMCLDSAQAKGMSVMTIEVFEGNPRSMSYCSRFGFREAARKGPVVSMSLAF